MLSVFCKHHPHIVSLFSYAYEMKVACEYVALDGADIVSSNNLVVGIDIVTRLRNVPPPNDHIAYLLASLRHSPYE